MKTRTLTKVSSLSAGTGNSVPDRSVDEWPQSTLRLGTCIAICLFGAIIYILKTRQGGSTLLPQDDCSGLSCPELYGTPRWTVDGNVRPCDDFHAYVCGRWISDREKKGFMAESLDLHLKYMHATLGALRTPTLSENLQGAAETGKTLLSACLPHMASGRLDLKLDVTFIFRQLNLSRVLEETSSLRAVAAGAEISFRFNLNGLVRLRPQRSGWKALLYAFPGASLRGVWPVEAELEPYVKAVFGLH